MEDRAIRMRRICAAVAIVAMIGVVQLASAPASKAATTGLVAAFGFDEGSGTTVTDASGNGNNGTITNATWAAAGKYGKALQFNGTNALVTIPNAASLQLSSGMTLEAWVNPSTVNANWRDVIYKGNDNFYLEATSSNASHPDAGLIAGGSYADAFGTAALTASTWSFLTETYDGSTLRLYLNGTQVASTAHTGSIKTSTNPLQIGGDSLYGQYFAGLVDNVRVYNVALTAAQIQTDQTIPVTSGPDTTPPTQPGTLTATAVSASELDLAWGASTDNVGVTGYLIERCQGAGCTNFAQIAAPAGTGTSYKDTGVSASTSYSYRVRATDAAGNLGSYSNTASATTPTPDTQPPTQPGTLTVTAVSTSELDLAWGASTDNVGVTGYLIERCQGAGCTNFAQIAAPAGTGTSYKDTGVSASTSYSYRVRATDGAGNLSSYSNTATAIPDTTPPTQPGTLTTTGVSASELDLAWGASTDNVGVTGYLIERCQGAGCTNFAQIAAPAGTGTTYKDTGVSASTSYSYRVRATDAAGNLGSYSNTASATTPTPDTQPPTQPGTLTATAVSASELDLAWGASTDNVGVTGYLIERCQGASCTNFAQIAAPAGTGTTYKDTTGLTASTSYSYRVRATDAAGNLGSYSNTASATTPTPDTQPPTQPGTLTATAVSASEVDLAWGASTDNVGVTGYLIERCQGASCTNFAQIAAPAGTGTTYKDTTGLTASTSYSYRVRATDAAGNLGPYSNTASATTPTPDTQPPTQPGTLTATAVSTSEVDLAWGASTDNVGVSGYLIERCQGAGCTNFAQIAAPAGTGTSYKDTSVSASTSYSYRVRATDAAGNLGPYSNTATAIPDTTPPTQPGTLTTTGVSTSEMDLAWGASTDNVGVTGYLIERCQGAGCTNFAQIATATGTSYKDTSVSASTSYSYRVRATDGAGNLGPYSNTASATTPAAPSGLVAAYAFDEGSGTTVTDASGNGHNGTVTNATWAASGKYGKALQFNGTNALVSIPDTASLHFSTGMTLEAWVNPSSVTASWRDVIYKGNDNFYLSATSNATVPDAGLIAGGSYADAYGTTALTANAWSFLTETYDGSMVRLYVNGTQVGSTAHTGSMATSTNPLQIGGDSIYGQYFTGLIDNIRVYNVALSTAQIQTDQNTGVILGPDTTPPTQPGTLTATAVSAGEVDLAWGASTDNVAVTGYQVERCQGASCTTFARIGTATATSYKDTSVSASTNYSYRVRATDAAGNLSPYSNMTSTTTPSGYSVSGTVSGLFGTVVLQDNGGDDLTAGANGTFTFGTLVAPGAAYTVTVKTNPTSQTCTVANGTGTATANITNVVVTCITLASDNFNRADGSLGSGWTDMTGGGLTISSQMVAGTSSSGNSGDIRTGESYANDQYSQVTVTSTLPTGTQYIGPVVRAQNGGQNLYAGRYEWNNNSPQLTLYKRINGTWTQLGSYSSGQLAAGTQLTLTAIGNTLAFAQNGTPRVTASDNTLASGAPGIVAGGTATADNWAAGTAVFQVDYLSTDANGVDSYDVLSANNGYGAQVLRVLKPTHPAAGVAHNFLFVLPVEGGLGTTFGDGLNTAQAADAQDQYNLTIIEPTFDMDPWYANHATDPNLQYDTFMANELVPWVRAHLATTGTEQNWLIGFSKSGIGGQDLILRHPDVFNLVASWDFPADMSTYDQFGADSAAAYGTQANFAANYQLTGAFLDARKTTFQTKNRIWIGGYNLYQQDVIDYDSLLTSEGIMHTNGLSQNLAHRWDSGWVPQALAALYQDSLH